MFLKSTTLPKLSNNSQVSAARHLASSQNYSTLLFGIPAILVLNHFWFSDATVVAF